MKSLGAWAQILTSNDLICHHDSEVVVAMAHSRESFIKELRSRVLISPRKTRPLLSSTPIYTALILQDNFHRNLICGFNQDGEVFFYFCARLGKYTIEMNDFN